MFTRALLKMVVLLSVIKIDFGKSITYKEIPSVSTTILQFTNLSLSHAESPVWDGDANTLYWVDVLNQNVHALDYRNWKHSFKHIEYGEVNVVVPVQNSSRLLVCARSEVYLMDWTKYLDSALRLVTVLDLGKPDNVINEGKADALGRFWAGTKGPQLGNNVVLDEAALYRMDSPSFTPVVQLKPVTISNGLVWSLNNSVMYYIDSPTKKIEAFDFDLNRGSLSNRRAILDIREYGFKKAIPDGMTIDEDGFLWVALMFEGSIIRINPDLGRIVEKLVLPVTHTTSLTWAGPGLDDLVVTSSRRNMKSRELSEQLYPGALFILSNIGTRGVPSYKVAFSNADQY